MFKYISLKVLTFHSLAHYLFEIQQNNCEWNSKKLAEDREREENPNPLNLGDRRQNSRYKPTFSDFLVCNEYKEHATIDAGIIWGMTSAIQNSVLTSPID